jgi:hypothetical protein
LNQHLVVTANARQVPPSAQSSSHAARHSAMSGTAGLALSFTNGTLWPSFHGRQPLA